MPTHTNGRTATATRTNGKAKSIQGEEFFDPDEALTQYAKQFLVCRDIKHQWKVLGYYRADGEVQRILECVRCETQRTDRWDPRTGERIAAHYDYPDDYQFEGSGGGIPNESVRRAVLSHAKVYDARHLMEAAVRRRERSRTRN